LHLSAVAAIYGGNSGEGSKFHLVFFVSCSADATVGIPTSFASSGLVACFLPVLRSHSEGGFLYLCPAKITQLEKIRVGIVNYLNTKPLLYGLLKPPIAEKIELTGDYPAKIAQMLLDDKIDVGLVPVTVLTKMPEYHIIGDYCIGTEGEIASVALFSEVPVNEIKKVYLDYQSQTSVELLKYLMKDYWGINPEIVQAENDNYRAEITGTTAGLVIGDRAFEQRKVSTFIYDLGSEWRKITGLPFVFAVWVSKKKLSDDFITEFNKANALGLGQIDEIAASIFFELYELKKYYTLHLSYRLDESKKKGMARFLELIP